MIFKYITLDLVSFIPIHPSTTIMLLSYTNELNGRMAATCRTASVGPLNCRCQYLHLAVFSCKSISSYNLWHCKCYRHKSRDLREINRDMHRMFAFTDLCIIWSYWCIIISSKQFALLNKSAHSHKYLLFNQFIN